MADVIDIGAYEDEAARKVVHIKKNPPKCENCIFFDNNPAHSSYMFCRRYPEYVRHDVDHWCGEYSRAWPEEV